MNEQVACPSCGAANSGASAYCGACGAPLRPATVPPVPCWNCRAPNPPGRAYCGQCGQHLAGPAVAPAPPAQGSGRNPVLLALAVVLVFFLGIASVFLILTLVEDRGGTGVGAPSATPTDELIVTPEPSLLPEATPTPPAIRTPKPKRTPQPTPTLGPPGSFVCYESMAVDGPVGSNWDLVRVDFRTYRGYDRVIYQLQRRGDELDGIAPRIAARPAIPGEGEFVGEPPRHPDSESRLNVVLANGVRDRARIDGYEPRGMKIVKALWTQRYQSHVNYIPPEDDPAMADVGVLSSVDVIGDACFYLRVVGWDGEGDDSASVFVDIEP